MKLKQRLILGYTVPILIMFLVAGLAHFATQNSIEADAEIAYNDSLFAMNRRTFEAMLNNEIGFRGFVITGNESFLEPLVEGRREFHESLADVKGTLHENTERQKQWNAVENIIVNNLIPWQDSVIRIRRRGTDSAARVAIAMVSSGKEKGWMDEARNIVDRLRANRDAALVTSRERALEAQHAISEIVFIGAGIGAVVAIIISLLLSNRLIQTINDAVTAITTSSAQIAATVAEQERTATHQATAVNETTATMDELAASSRQSSEQADAISGAARQSLALAEEGTGAVQQTLDSMEMLKERVGSIAEQILRLSEHTSQIGSITNLVSDLANQTNLLALNAAVEAARAGEHGKGFAVVAVEIRKLADQSKKSAERINALVLDIQKSTNSTVMATEEGTKTVDEGIRLARQTGEAFDTSAASISSTFESVQQITLNMRQQAAAIKQVVEAMGSINTGAKETATGVSQTKVGVQTLVDAAQKLKQMTG